jgi:hypothetical protein
MITYIKFNKISDYIRRLKLGVLLVLFGTVACIAEFLFYLNLALLIGGFILYHFVFDNLIAVNVPGMVYQGQTINVKVEYNNDLDDRRISLALARLIESTGEWDILDTWDHTAQIGRNFSISTYWTAEETGFYWAHAEFYDLAEGRGIGRHASDEYFNVVEGSEPVAPYELRIWCGNEIKGNPDEQLNARFAHQIAVEIIDKSTGQPPSQTFIPVTFTTYLYPQQIQVGVAISVVSHTISVGDSNVELAYTNPNAGIILSQQDPDSGQHQIHLVEASCDSAEEKIYFFVYSIKDAENSHLPGDTTHQTGYQYGQWIEVPGDNYLDNGDSTDFKDVRIELDYYLWPDADYDVNQVAALIETVLVTAGIHAEVLIDSQIPSGEMPDTVGRHDRMALLARHKNPVDPFTTEDRRWHNSIHVILGSEGRGDTIGITEMYPESGIFNKWYTMHRGSGDVSYSAPFLDSVGCFVFTKSIQEFPGLALELNRAIALAAAHEIGHALGMAHYNYIPDVGPIKNVMYFPIWNAFTAQNGFELYGFFDKRTLNGDFDIGDLPNDGMNIRNILGIDCVNSIYEGS